MSAQQLAIVQNAYVVANLERACDRVHRLFGVGPFVADPHPPLTRAMYAQACDAAQARPGELAILPWAERTPVV